MGKTPTTTTQIQKTELPAWVEKASEENYGYAKDLSGQLMGAYSGPRTAGVSPEMRNFLRLSQQVSDPSALNDMTAKASGLIDQSTTQWDDTQAQKYMSPFINNVEQAALGRSRDALGMGMNMMGAKASGMGAFGGSRHGVQEATLAAEAQKNFGELSANLRNQGYTNAQQAFGADRDAAARGAASTMQLGFGRQNANIAGLQAAQSGAMLGQGFADREVQALRDSWSEQQQAQLAPLNVRLSALGMSPYGQTTSGTMTKSGGDDPFSSFLGLGLMGAKIFGLSDRKSKTDIEKVGKDPDSGEMLYAYRYKNDPKTYPKVVGPMAQDIEKTQPHRVKKVGGKRIVAGGLGFGG
jgi:hypothetical protein